VALSVLDRAKAAGPTNEPTQPWGRRGSGFAGPPAAPP